MYCYAFLIDESSFHGQFGVNFVFFARHAQYAFTKATFIHLLKVSAIKTEKLQNNRMGSISHYWLLMSSGVYTHSYTRTRVRTHTHAYVHTHTNTHKVQKIWELFFILITIKYMRTLSLCMCVCVHVWVGMRRHVCMGACLCIKEISLFIFNYVASIYYV